MNTQTLKALGRGMLMSLLSLLPALPAMADEMVVADANGNELVYSYDTADGPATLVGIQSYSSDEAKAGRIVIADRVTDVDGRGHDVCYIGGSVRNRQDVVSIVFGANIIATGGPDGSQGDAFYYCQKLESVTLNKKLEILGRYTFQSCSKLSSVNLAEATSLQQMQYRSMQGTAIRDITVPQSVRLLDDVFSGCDSVRTLTFLADSVPADFYGYHNRLQSVILGSGVKYVGEGAFQNNYNCRTLRIDEGVSDLTIGSYAFSENDRLASVGLPFGVKELQQGAFYSCDSLRTFTFADGSPIAKIPQDCFNYCLSLERLTLPDAVQEVGPSAFGYCRSMTELNFGTGLISLPGDNWSLFYGCDQLRKVTLPGAQYPFTASMWMPAYVTLYVHPDLVDTYTTSEFTSAYRVVALGQPTDFNVTTTGGGQLQAQVEAIGDARNVMTLTVSGPLNGTDIDYLHAAMPNLRELNLKASRIVEGGDSYHQWYMESGSTARMYDYYGPWNTENDVVGYAMFYNMPMLERITLPDGTLRIGDHALSQDSHDSYRLSYVGLPASITAIGREAFRHTGITEIEIPAGVTRLEDYTFYNCRSLQRAVLPDGITFVGNSCFSECYALEDANIPTSVETIDQYAFYNNYSRTTPITLPATLKSIGYRAFYNNNKVRSITFSEGLETISSYAFSHCKSVENITLPASLTTLDSNAFEDCDSLTEFRFPANITEVPSAILYSCDKLRRVVLAGVTTRIGSSAFAYCPQLADINISAMTSLTAIDNYAFEHTGLKTVALPNTITELGYCTFQYCDSLTSINIPTGVDYVPDDFCEGCRRLASVQMHDGIRTVRTDAFYGCRTLPTIDLNDQIERIENDAFRDCDSLRLDRLPAALTFIGDGAFYNARSLSGHLTIPAGVTRIDGNAFNGTSITAVTLPDSITTIGSGLFANCAQLAEVKLPGNITRIPNYMFQSTPQLAHIDIPASLREVGYAAFDQSGITSIALPDSLQVIESKAFSNSQLREFRVPDGVRGDPGSYTWANCRRLKSIYLGRNQDYSQLYDFTCLSGSDSLQLLRIYAAVPPQCYSWYMGYRQGCVLEVPEDAIEAYRAADTWKEFKEIRGFFDGDVLADLDFAVLQKLYRELDGQHWKQPWDLSNNHRSVGKWQGVVTVGDYITEIDLTGQGLQGELCDSLFLLTRLEKLNLSDNTIRADLTTLLADAPACTTLTDVSLCGNEFTGDIYPFAAKLPNLTRLDVSYNRLTAVSQPISREKLSNDRFARGFQFVDYKTRQPVADAPVIDLRLGVPAAIESNTLQTYRHEYGDYDFSFSSLARLQSRDNGGWDYSQELTKTDDGLWDAYSGYYDYVFRGPKGVATAYTHTSPWWSYITYILRFDWTDGDVNADQTVDVADLQSIVYYALHDSKANGQMFNYTTADVNGDARINVSDIVGSVEYIMGYEEPAASPYYVYNRAAADARNRLTADGQSLLLTNEDAVSALQLTVSGASARQLRVSDELRATFSVAMRDVAGGVRLVAYSPEGRSLSAGVHTLLSGLPARATIADVRLADAGARHLGVSIDGDATSIKSNCDLPIGDLPIYGLDGQKLNVKSANGKLPAGMYIINGKKVVIKE